MAVLYSLTEFLHVLYIVSASMALVIAATNNYLINNYWTFREQKDHNPSLVRGWLRYMATIVAVEVVYLGLLALFTEVFGWWYMVSAAVGIAITSAMRFFFLTKWVWGDFRVRVGRWIRV